CQSFEHPSTLEYSHIGETTIRLASVNERIASGSKRCGIRSLSHTDKLLERRCDSLRIRPDDARLKPSRSDAPDAPDLPRSWSRPLGGPGDSAGSRRRRRRLLDRTHGLAFERRVAHERRDVRPERHYVGPAMPE